MPTLTNSEKVKRYDALQAAIHMTLNLYRERRRVAMKHCNGNRGDIISAYEYGVEQTLKSVIEDLERWV